MPQQYLHTVHSTYLTVHLKWKFGEELCLFLFLFRTVTTIPGSTVDTVVIVFFVFCL